MLSKSSTADKNNNQSPIKPSKFNVSLKNDKASDSDSAFMPVNISHPKSSKPKSSILQFLNEIDNQPKNNSNDFKTVSKTEIELANKLSTLNLNKEDAITSESASTPNHSPLNQKKIDHEINKIVETDLTGLNKANLPKEGYAFISNPNNPSDFIVNFFIVIYS
jgi:hypothetical protein